MIQSKFYSLPQPENLAARYQVRFWSAPPPVEEGESARAPFMLEYRFGPFRFLFQNQTLHCAPLEPWVKLAFPIRGGAQLVHQICLNIPMIRPEFTLICLILKLLDIFFRKFQRGASLCNRFKIKSSIVPIPENFSYSSFSSAWWSDVDKSFGKKSCFIGCCKSLADEICGPFC